MKYNWDLENIGESIKKTVQEAVDSKDFASMNQNIRSTINGVFGGFADSGPDIDLGTKASQSERSWERKPQEPETARPPAKGRQQVYTGTAGKKAFAVTFMAIGYSLGSLLTLGFLVTAMSSSLIGGGILNVALGTLGTLILPCAAMAFIGTKRLARVKRFQLYQSTIRNEEYCNVKDLAERIRKSEKYVVKDLDWMMRRMWFLQGHFDDQNTCIMTTDNAYREYLKLMRQREEQQRIESEKAAAAAREEHSRKSSMDPQVLAVIEKGNQFIDKIRQCNDAIAGEEVSAKIFRMETLTRRIFARVEEEPDTVADIRRLMEYYLPTAIKLLEAYKDLDKQPVQGENILSSKREIEETLDTLNGAFEVLLDDMFQDKAWDVSTDVSVLKTMLAQEGLTEKDFKTGGK